MRLRLLAGTVAATLAMALAPAVVAAEGAPRIIDPIVIRSFDGTPIVGTLMLPPGASRSSKVPAILETHGWGGERRRTPGGTAGRLLDRGYAILTWDSRGFGDSGGEASPGGPAEVGDARRLVDFLAARGDIAKDRPGDPKVGWIGGSNAGGVQLNTAAVDRRLDAIAPEISWGDLVADLLPNGVPKQSWDTLLYTVGAAGAGTGGLDSPAGAQTGVYAEEIHRGYVQLNTTQQLSSDVRRFFASRSTTIRSHRITAPTLLVQGTIDTLFPLEDAFANYRNLKAAGTPAKLVAYCSGHTLVGCTYRGGGADDARTGRPLWQDRIVAWMDRWVAGREVATGPEVEWQAQDGRYRGASRWPLPGTRTVTGRAVSTGTLVGP
ncbi:MAG: alpha/beta hydrolase family protein, partial [Egibacteraceae bacterium]